MLLLYDMPNVFADSVVDDNTYLIVTHSMSIAVFDIICMITFPKWKIPAILLPSGNILLFYYELLAVPGMLYRYLCVKPHIKHDTKQICLSVLLGGLQCYHLPHSNGGILRVLHGGHGVYEKIFLLSLLTLYTIRPVYVCMKK